MRPRTPNDRGFTLMELVVVLMVFALIATMSLQALSGTLRNRDKLVSLDEQNLELSQLLTLLRADLQAAVPVFFHAPDGTIQSAFDIADDQSRIALSISGQMYLPGETGAGFSRVIWQLDRQNNVLQRQSWPVLNPASAASVSPVVVMTTQVIGLQFRTMTAASVWVSGGAFAVNGVGAALPKAVDVILETAQYGKISTVVSYP